MATAADAAMSPLVRSLLALAALLAAAGVVVSYEPCAVPGLLIGTESSFFVNLKPITVPPPGGAVSYPDDCDGNRTLTGVRVQACNVDLHGLAPALMPLDPSDLLTDVDVYCEDGCPYGITVYIQQYCL